MSFAADPPPFAASVLSGAHGPLLFDHAGAGPTFWPALRGISRFALAVAGTHARACLLCGEAGLDGGMAGTMAAMQGGASAAVALEVSRALVGELAGAHPALEAVGATYRRPVRLPGWVDVRAAAERRGDGWACRAALWDAEGGKELVVVSSEWIPDEAGGNGVRTAAEDEHELPPVLSVLLDKFRDPGLLPTSEHHMFALLAAGSPVVTSHLLPPDDPRAWGFPAGMSRSGFIWRSPKEGRLYSRMHSVQTPTALEAWFEVPGSLLSADGTLHPAIQYTYADSWLNGFALGVSVAVTVTASLRCSFTQAGRRFCGGWVVLRGRPVERTGRRVRLAAELASEAGDVLMRAEGEFAVIGPAPRM